MKGPKRYPPPESRAASKHVNSERFVMPSAGQTLTNLAVFDASSHFPHLCKIDASSNYIQIWETTPLLLIFDYFTSIL